MKKRIMVAGAALSAVAVSAIVAVFAFGAGGTLGPPGDGIQVTGGRFELAFGGTTISCDVMEGVGTLKSPAASQVTLSEISFHNAGSSTCSSTGAGGLAFTVEPNIPYLQATSATAGNVFSGAIIIKSGTCELIAKAGLSDTFAPGASRTPVAKPSVLKQPAASYALTEPAEYLEKGNCPSELVKHYVASKQTATAPAAVFFLFDTTHPNTPIDFEG